MEKSMKTLGGLIGLDCKEVSRWRQMVEQGRSWAGRRAGQLIRILCNARHERYPR